MRSAAKDDNALTRILLSNARSDGGTTFRLVMRPEPVKSSCFDQQQRQPDSRFTGEAARTRRLRVHLPNALTQAEADRKERGFIVLACAKAAKPSSPRRGRP